MQRYQQSAVNYDLNAGKMCIIGPVLYGMLFALDDRLTASFVVGCCF